LQGLGVNNRVGSVTLELLLSGNSRSGSNFKPADMFLAATANEDLKDEPGASNVKKLKLVQSHSRKPGMHHPSTVITFHDLKNLFIFFRILCVHGRIHTLQESIVMGF